MLIMSATPIVTTEVEVSVEVGGVEVAGWKKRSKIGFSHQKSREIWVKIQIQPHKIK